MKTFGTGDEDEELDESENEGADAEDEAAMMQAVREMQVAKVCSHRHVLCRGGKLPSVEFIVHRSPKPKGLHQTPDRTPAFYH